MPRDAHNNEKRLPPGTSFPGKEDGSAGCEFFASRVRFDPTATADRLSSGLLAEGFPVLAADARSRPGF